MPSAHVHWQSPRSCNATPRACRNSNGTHNPSSQSFSQALSCPLRVGQCSGRSINIERVIKRSQCRSPNSDPGSACPPDRRTNNTTPCLCCSASSYTVGRKDVKSKDSHPIYMPTQAATLVLYTDRSIKSCDNRSVTNKVGLSKPNSYCNA